MADDLKRLEANLARAVAAATVAQAALDAARARLKQPAEKQFFTLAEMAAELAAERATADRRFIENMPGLIKGVRSAFDPTYKSEFSHMARPSTPQDRALCAWLQTWIAADRIVKASGGPGLPPPFLTAPSPVDVDAKAAATAAEAITRAGALRRGEITELPTNETARAIIKSGRRRRAED